MSHWNGTTIVRWRAESVEGYPGWSRIDCGCCGGIKWGGEYPRTCDQCGGSGVLCRHDATRTLALYPGGPLAGHDD